MIRLKELTKYYGKVKALNKISLQINAGKIYGLLGPNGSGKSTLIKLVLKILDPSEGEIIFEDDDLKNNFYNEVGYLPEERGLFLNSTVKDVLTYFGKLKNLNGTVLNEKIAYWLEKFTLTQNSSSLVGSLSKGNRQKVQLITALLHEPKLLILDEPYSGFDPVNQELLNTIIREYYSTNRVIILSTHLMNFVENICTDVIFLNKGELLYTGTLENLLRKYSEETYYIEIEKNEAAEKILSELQYKNLKQKQPSLNEIFLKELNNRETE